MKKHIADWVADNWFPKELKGKKKPITDKQRLDWLQEGHCVIGLSKADKSVVFSADFHEQDWSEFPNVRDAIDFAMNKTKR